MSCHMSSSLSSATGATGATGAASAFTGDSTAGIYPNADSNAKFAPAVSLQFLPVRSLSALIL